MGEREEFSVGQKLVIRSRKNYGLPYSFQTIVKVTDTQIVLGNGERYMIRSGEKRGSASSWSAPCIARNWSEGRRLTTVEEAEIENEKVGEKLKERALVQKLNHFDFSYIKKEDLDAIGLILKKYMG